MIKVCIRAWLQPCRTDAKGVGLQPLVMDRPSRNVLQDNILSSARTFFATTKPSEGRALLQSERNATLMIDVLHSYVTARKFRLHDFVIMPDHLHLLLTVGDGMTIERAMQFIKGGFSYRLKKECGYLGEVWQRGFSETRVEDSQSLIQHREYIAENPVCFVQKLANPRCLFYSVDLIVGSRDSLGEFEQIVLLALVRLADTAYGVPIRHAIEER